VWNAVIARLPVRPREALVLYLAGREDLDRVVLVGKGFHPHNLIAIERDASTVRALRQKGVLTVEGEFIEAVRAVSSRRDVQVVAGDFGCAPYNAEFIAGLVQLFLNPSLRESVFVFNFLRGRDSATNDLRARALARHGPDFFLATTELEKHRGRFFMDLLFGMWCDLLRQHEATESQIEWARRQILSPEHLPSFLSYKSRTGPVVQVFDSLVVKNPASKFLDYVEGEATHRDVAREFTGQKVRGSAAAVLAHRTMRLDGRLEPRA
jgi:hypothetical protein